MMIPHRWVVSLSGATPPTQSSSLTGMAKATSVQLHVSIRRKNGTDEKDVITAYDYDRPLQSLVLDYTLETRDE